MVCLTYLRYLIHKYNNLLFTHLLKLESELGSLVRPALYSSVLFHKYWYILYTFARQLEYSLFSSLTHCTQLCIIAFSSLMSSIHFIVCHLSNTLLLNRQCSIYSSSLLSEFSHHCLSLRLPLLLLTPIGISTKPLSAISILSVYVCTNSKPLHVNSLSIMYMLFSSVNPCLVM